MKNVNTTGSMLSLAAGLLFPSIAAFAQAPIDPPSPIDTPCISYNGTMQHSAASGEKLNKGELLATRWQAIRTLRAVAFAGALFRKGRNGIDPALRPRIHA